MRAIDKLKNYFGVRLKTYFNQGNWVDSNAPGRLHSSGGGRMYWIPGSRYNWDRLTGDLWACPAVQACLNIIHRNFPQAPWIIRKKSGTGKKMKWVPEPNHPLLALLNRPNPIYDGNVLKQNIVDSLKLNGNAYVIIERSNGQAAKELWWVPNDWVQPYTAPSQEGRLPMAVDVYRITGGNRKLDVPPEDMLHIRDGCDPHDPRLGLSELASASRDVNTLQQLSTYKPNILRNMGVIGKFVSPKTDLVTFDPKTLKEHIDSQSTGDNAGSTVVVDFPVDVEYPGASPKDLDVGNMGDMSEANICALMGVPAHVVGLHVGRLSKTYANIKEAREQLWEECLIPLGAMIACQLGYKLMPEFAPNRDNPEQVEAYLAEYQLGFDYSDVRPLQPDLDALNTRELAVFTAGITTVAQFCEATFRDEPAPEIAELYYSDLHAPEPMEEPVAGEGKPNETEATEPAVAGKAAAWETRIEAELAELERLHAGSDFVGATGIVYSGNGVNA